MTLAQPRAPEDGFALVTALIAVLLFALFAYAVLAADRGAVADVDAQVQRATLEAAADAGLATAIDGLASQGRDRWAIDGRSRRFMLDDIEITANIEDERGKIALNGIKPDQARRLFQAVGVSGARLDRLTDNLLDWEDGGERPNGARAIDYEVDDVRPRNGPIRTLGELMAIKGMDADLFSRIAPALTLFFGEGAFDRTNASPLALKVMTTGAMTQAQPSNGQAALSVGATQADYIGRPLTISITARNSSGGVFRRSTIIQLTGQPGRPVWVRAID